MCKYERKRERERDTNVSERNIDIKFDSEQGQCHLQ